MARHRRLTWRLLLLLAVVQGLAGVARADTYEERRDGLVPTVFTQDHCEATTITALDQRSFAELNAVVGPKLVDNPGGWSVEERTGGRPFICLDAISVDSQPVTFDPSGFSPGTSGIPQSELDAHFAAGRTVNRLWFTHNASNGYPIVVVLTPDGFFNLGGATAPRLQGAALRTGFIGEPFHVSEDYAQHTDNLHIQVVDDDILRLLFDVHSEAGEATVEAELRWDPAYEQPELVFRSAHLPALSAALGFAGIDFMRGPTLHGMLQTCPGTMGGIEAFHDGRSVLVYQPKTTLVRSLLTPPVQPGTVVREDLVSGIYPGAVMIMDQPQDVAQYFSKTPSPPYDDRTDLHLRLLASSAGEVHLRRAQTAVDLDDLNPEANETVNLFLATSMTSGHLEELSFEVRPGEEDWEARFSEVVRGVVFVSDQQWASGSLYFLALDASLAPIAPAVPLTDGVITDPRRPAVSSGGRYVVFDADDYGRGSRQRVYLLDLLRGSVKRLSVDPAGASNDYAASLGNDGDHFAMITTRRGTTARVNVQSVEYGLGCSYGNEEAIGTDAHWSPTRDEIVYTTATTLELLARGSGATTTLATGRSLAAPTFSADGDRVAYVASTGVRVVNRDGTGDALVIADGAHPTWAGASHLIVQRTEAAETDLFLVDLASGTPTRLTPADAVDASEPAFVLRLPECTGDPTTGDSDSDGVCNGPGRLHRPRPGQRRLVRRSGR